MKYEIIVTSKFKKDIKLMKKQGKDMEKMWQIIKKLADGEMLDERYRDHSLTGNFSGYRECHIAPDWLLVYKINNSELLLLLARTGSHSELF